MYILLIFLIIGIGAILLARRDSIQEDDLDFPLWIVAILSFGVAITMILSIWYNNTNVEKEVQQRLITKQEIEKARNTPSQEVERVAILNKIIEYNQKIAADKYDNNTQWDLWIPDTLANMEPIK